MEREDLKISWAKTSVILQSARSHVAAIIDIAELAEFDSYLGANEFELALDELDAIYRNLLPRNRQLIDRMIEAANSMQLTERVAELMRERTVQHGPT